MCTDLNDLTLEDIANVKIKAYRNDVLYDDKDKKDAGGKESKHQENFYHVYILTYIKHIVRIKTNLALHGGLYSNYFEKYEEESISNIMFENLLNKVEEEKGKKKKEKDKDKDKEKDKEPVTPEKRDLNYSIKELLKKLIKSYKIRENKIFLVTGMLGCGKTTCVSLAIEYFNKFLQIEKIMNKKNENNKTLSVNNEFNGKKSYKKTPYANRKYEDSQMIAEANEHGATLRINCNEPLFNFTPKKKRKRKGSDTTDFEEPTDPNYPVYPVKGKTNAQWNLQIEQINSNIRNIFENNDLSPLRKNANIRSKIQFEQTFKEQTNDMMGPEFLAEEEDEEFSEKYKKIVEEIKTEEKEERCIYTVRISAYLYKDDVHCMRSILLQLYNYLNREEKFESNLLNEYVVKLESLLIEINNSKKQVLLIIENVEKFCLQNKQNLLYTLFDLMHKKNICINIICLTNILDITQTLEKRIKSRFTFEMLHISPILDIQEISKLVYKILYVNLDDFHLIKKYYSVYFTYNDLIKIQKFLQVYNSTMQKEIADSELLKRWSYDISYGLDIRHIYHTCVDAILSICEYKKILNSNQTSFKPNTLLDPPEFDVEDIKENEEEEEEPIESLDEDKHAAAMEKLGFFKKEKRINMEFLQERQGKLASTPMKGSAKNKETLHFNDLETSPRKMKEAMKKFGGDKFLFQLDTEANSPRKLKENLNKFMNEKNQLQFDTTDEHSPHKLKEVMKQNKKIESQYIMNNVQSKFIRRHYIKKVLRDLCSIEYMILCAFTRLYKKDILPKTLYVIILEINKFKQAYPQEQMVGFSYDAYRRSFFRLVDLDIIILSSYSLNHLNIKNYSNDLFGLHEPTKFPYYDIFLENLETYNININLIQWVKHNIEVMQ